MTRCLPSGCLAIGGSVGTLSSPPCSPFVSQILLYLTLPAGPWRMGSPFESGPSQGFNSFSGVFPFYPNNQACRWTLQAPAGFVVQITFLDIELEKVSGCIYDQLVVNTGSNNVSFCGLTAKGLSLSSTGNFMEVSFTTDDSIQGRGFNISYRQGMLTVCNRLF
uniref:CUB domain-containing protein n=1 Tax=Paramormyrops kingsleyae TaxID=1676925 RepID=A0A3B3T1H6_9TELE